MMAKKDYEYSPWDQPKRRESWLKGKDQ